MSYMLFYNAEYQEYLDHRAKILGIYDKYRTMYVSRYGGKQRPLEFYYKFVKGHIDERKSSLDLLEYKQFIREKKLKSLLA